MANAVRRFSLQFVFAITLAFLPAITNANAQSALNIRYSPELGEKSPSLDIYPFVGADNAPVLVYVHGGGWQRGSRRQVNLKPGHFNDIGYIFISLDYRLVPDFRIEDQVKDIDSALWWIHTNIADHGGNPQNLHLMGHSAGAHLVSLSILNPETRTSELLKLGAIRSVISDDTLAYDIPRLSTNLTGRLHRVHEAAFGTDMARWRRLSPQLQIGTNVNIPPFMVIYSGQGITRARRDVAVSFAEILRAKGVHENLFDGSKYSHRQITVAIGEQNDLTKSIDEFLQRFR